MKTYDDIRAAIETFFKAGYDATPIAWTKAYIPQSNVPYVRIRMVLATDHRITIGSPDWRATGSIMIQCFASDDDASGAPYIGQSGALQMADAVARLFRGSTISGVRLLDADITDVGDDGQFYQVNVSIDFNCDRSFAVGTA